MRALHSQRMRNAGRTTRRAQALRSATWPPAGRGTGEHGAAGFTLVELVLVITVLGLLAAVAGPRFFDAGAFAARGWHDEVASALRYAQKLAVASGCPVRATVDAAGYALAQQAPIAGHCDPSDGTFATAVRLPDGQPVAAATPAGIAVGPPLTVIFDAGGVTDLGADQAVNVAGRPITVVAASGLVRTP